MQDEEDFEDVGSDGDIPEEFEEPPTPGHPIPPGCIERKGTSLRFGLTHLRSLKPLTGLKLGKSSSSPTQHTPTIKTLMVSSKISS